MRRTKEARQSVMSFKVTQKMRRTIELLSAHLTIQRGSRYTLSDVMEESVLLLAKQEKINGKVGDRTGI